MKTEYIKNVTHFNAFTPFNIQLRTKLKIISAMHHSYYIAWQMCALTCSVVQYDQGNTFVRVVYEDS